MMAMRKGMISKEFWRWKGICDNKSPWFITIESMQVKKKKKINHSTDIQQINATKYDDEEGGVR